LRKESSDPNNLWQLDAGFGRLGAGEKILACYLVGDWSKEAASGAQNWEL
jgi:hypothetical protein